MTWQAIRTRTLTVWGWLRPRLTWRALRRTALAVVVVTVLGVSLEAAIRAVTVIPGASEFGYDPAPRVRLASPGVTVSENAHQSASLSDWTLSIDELTALCPNLEHVSLVVAWFGDDLRCGECSIAPRVEAASRDVVGAEWSVAGLARGDVQVVSTHEVGPAYGGTPSDAAVLAAVKDNEVTQDVGGSLGTREAGDAIVSRIQRGAD